MNLMIHFVRKLSLFPSLSLTPSSSLSPLPYFLLLPMSFFVPLSQQPPTEAAVVVLVNLVSWPFFVILSSRCFPPHRPTVFMNSRTLLPATFHEIRALPPAHTWPLPSPQLINTATPLASTQKHTHDDSSSPSDATVSFQVVVTVSAAVVVPPLSQKVSISVEDVELSLFPFSRPHGGIQASWMSTAPKEFHRHKPKRSPCGLIF